MHCSGLLLNVCVGVALWEDVGMFLAEYVADPATGNYFQASSTHPYSERNFYKHQSQCVLFKKHYALEHNAHHYAHQDCIYLTKNTVKQ